MKLCKKLTVLAAMWLLLSAMIILPATAVSPLHNASTEYLTSPYHAQLQSVTLTGDQRTDVVLVALSQLGYHEGNSDADMGGGSSGTRDFVEYNRIYGKLDNNQGNGVSYGYSWCCAFATWCVKHAGVPVSVVKTEVSCDRLVDWLMANSTYKTASSGYKPQTGDLIFFKSAGSSRRHAGHIGIVRYCDGSKVYTVEGNTNTYNVAVREYNLTDTYIVGYGVPAYVSKPEAAIDFSKERPGTYFVTVTTSALNVRSGPGTSHSIVGSVDYGDKVTVTAIENGWGKIMLGGTEGWMFLGYAQYVPSARYTIYFDSNGGAPVMPSFPKQDGVAATLPTDEPTRAGYKFAGWATKKNATVAEYSAGGKFDLDENTVLYAVWSEGDFKVSFYNGDTLLQTGAYPHGYVVTQPEQPTKAADETYEYVFAGWDTDGDGKADVLPDGKITASADIVCRAVFDKKYVEYTVRFVGYKESTISEAKYHYGDAVTVPQVTQVIDGKYKYSFDGWTTPIVATVTGNAVYEAKYKQDLAKYTVSFVGSDGKVIVESEYYYGDTVVIPAELPQKPADQTYTYTFKEWYPAVTPVAGDAIYTAQFDSTYIDYVVRFVDGDGKEVEIARYHYGDVPSLRYQGVVTKTSDETYDYTFTGWDKEFVGITGDTVYTALFEGVKRIYTITFFDDDGSVISTAEYNFGEEIASPTVPVKEGYRFVSWSPELGKVNGNMSFKAVYEAEEVTTPVQGGSDDTPGTPGQSDGLPTGLIISLVVVVVLAVAFVIFIIVRRKKPDNN